MKVLLGLVMIELSVVEVVEAEGESGGMMIKDGKNNGENGEMCFLRVNMILKLKYLLKKCSVRRYRAQQ